MLEYFTLNSKWITKWKSKGLSNKNLEVPCASSNTLSPEINYNENKLRLKVRGSILQQKKLHTIIKKLCSLRNNQLSIQ